MKTLKILTSSPIFWLGISLRILCLISFESSAIEIFYSPFLKETSVNIDINPWKVWLDSGGTLDAFPYGYMMWFVFLPITLLFNLIGIETSLAYFLTIFLVDVLLCGTLIKLTPGKTSLVLKIYWLSPIIIIASYALGLNDLIPALFLLIALLFLRYNKFILSSMLLVFAISAKLSMLIALPFFLIYILNNRSHRHHLFSFTLTFIIFALVLGLPLLLSESAASMLFGNPEILKIFYLALPIGQNVLVYMVPLLYLILLYMGWRVRPLNFELFSVFVGVSFLAIVLLTPNSPGWFIWVLPFLVLYQSRSDKIAINLSVIFSIAYLINVLATSELNFLYAFEDHYIVDLFDTLITEYFILQLLQTFILFSGGLIALRMWREGITRSSFFRFNQKPITLGIAGDSGAGKDTLSDSLESLIGSHSVVKLSGDDYHKWDRHGPMWQVMTHINPMANDLQSFSNDLLSLIDGKSINQRHYDHSSGKMTKPRLVKSNQFILVSGLHTFSLPLARDVCDLKVFLNIDEDLRKFFKIKRDVNERGHTLEKVLSSIESRKIDSERFIDPQAIHADMLISLKPLNKESLKNFEDTGDPNLKLEVKIRNSYNEASLQRVLIGICGLHVDLVTNKDGSESTLTIEGDSKAEDMAQAAALLSSETLEYLDENPVWEDGMHGIMQIVIFSQISQLVTRSVVD